MKHLRKRWRAERKMKSAKPFLRFTGSAILIVACTAISVQAQQRDPNQPRPTPTPTPTPPPITKVPRGVTSRSQTSRLTDLPGIYGQIRWKKELGLPYDPSQGRPPYHICNMFRLLLTMQEQGSPGTFGVPRTAYYRASSELAEDGHYYICNYQITKLNGVSLPHDQTMVLSTELDAQVLRGTENGRWTIGSDALPPPGQQRVIIIVGGRTNNGITLTDNQPRATVDFEMVYRSIPAPAR
jgi:hypothetical protein